MSNAPLLSPELAEELEIVCQNAIAGDPPSEAVAQRLRSDVLHLLRENGHDKAQVWAKSDKGGTEVQILFPQPEKKVKTIRLRLK